MLSFFTWISVICVSYLYKEVLLFLLVKPTIPIKNQTFSIIFYFIFTDITEIFSVYITLIFFFGNQIFMLYFFYHFLVFISPGLYNFELRYLKFVFIFSFFFWLLSIFVLNKILLPITWNFFLSFQTVSIVKSVNLYFEAKLNEYLNFYLTLYYICLFNCQAFMILGLFLYYIKGNLIIVKKFRKFFYYIFIIFSTLLTPPDVISQLLISISTIIIYELLIFSIVLRSSLKFLVR